MTDRVTTPCRVSWCDSTHHATRNIVKHRAVVASFADRNVFVRLVWAERTDGRPSVPPGVQVRRLDASTYTDMIDLIPAEARLWAEVIAALDPSEVLKFGRALVDGASLLEIEGTEEDA